MAFPNAKPRALDSYFWLEVRGDFPNQGIWCKCCNIKVQQCTVSYGWDFAVLWIHFESNMHRENYELAKLAGEIC